MNRLEYKLRKLIGGKLTGTFKSFFKGDGMEVADFRKYEEGDDFKSINWKLTAKHNRLFVNVFKQEKDLNIDIFFDINRNWLGGEQQLNYNLISDNFIDIFLLAKKYGAKLNIFYYDFDLNMIMKESIGNNKQLAYSIMAKIKKHLNKSPKSYFSSMDKFLNIQKTITRKRVIIIFSDFLLFNEDASKKIKYLGEKNTLFISKVKIGQIVGFNYNKISLNKNMLDSDTLNIYYF